MKAHIPAKAALSKKSKQAVREYVDSYEKDCMRRAGTERRRNLLASR